MCFILDVIKGPLLFTKFCVPTLSSQDFDTLDTVFKSMFIICPGSNTSRLADTNSLTL